MVTVDAVAAVVLSIANALGLGMGGGRFAAEAGFAAGATRGVALAAVTALLTGVLVAATMLFDRACCVCIGVFVDCTCRGIGVGVAGKGCCDCARACLGDTIFVGDSKDAFGAAAAAAPLCAPNAVVLAARGAAAEVAAVCLLGLAVGVCLCIVCARGGDAWECMIVVAVVDGRRGEWSVSDIGGGGGGREELVAPRARRCSRGARAEEEGAGQGRREGKTTVEAGGQRNPSDGAVQSSRLGRGGHSRIALKQAKREKIAAARSRRFLSLSKEAKAREDNSSSRIYS